MTSTPGRLTSLDVFRGITIAAMIVVNNPGNWNAVFPQLSHAAWHGCTLADVVFPFFIFIMGMAMPLAFARRRASVGLYRHIWWRAATLVALGLILNLVHAWPHLDLLRLPGVLQRIGVTYLIAAFIVTAARPTRFIPIAAGLLILHWALLTLVPFGGHPAGSLTPEHNLASYLDHAVFGAHMLTPRGDPEGLLGLVSSVATALLGATAGWWLSSSSTVRGRLLGLMTAGVIAVLLGIAWSYALPLNKALWTGSYAMLTSGLATLAFAVCYLVVDVRGLRSWARPVIWLGVSPLAIYFLSELVGRMLERAWIPRADHLVSIKDLIFWNGLAPMIGDAGGVRSSFLFALGYTLFWIAVAGFLARSSYSPIAKRVEQHR